MSLKAMIEVAACTRHRQGELMILLEGDARKSRLCAPARACDTARR